jgi:hypothetical protein
MRNALTEMSHFKPIRFVWFLLERKKGPEDIQASFTVVGQSFINGEEKGIYTIVLANYKKVPIENFEARYDPSPRS